jgi:hypothetical protein
MDVWGDAPCGGVRRGRVWVTIDASFLAYPAWLAVQKADLIIGPIAVGLYWLHRRPGIASV